MSVLTPACNVEDNGNTEENSHIVDDDNVMKNLDEERDNPSSYLLKPHRSLDITERNRRRYSSIIDHVCSQKVNINRPVYNQEEFNALFTVHEKSKYAFNDALVEFCGLSDEKSPCNSYCWKSAFFTFFPFLSIMRTYNMKNDLLYDLSSGLTVGIMNIPQGMAYAMLAGLKPIYGLYVSFFPPLLYFFLGTSRQLSLGTFAVISLMLSVPIDRVMFNSFQNISSIEAQTFINESFSCHLKNNTLSINDARLQVAMVVTLMTGLIQLVMGFLKLGFFTIYLSDPMIMGFTSGAAIHVTTSQIPYILGISVSKFNGPFKLIRVYVDLFSKIKTTNLATLGVSAACLFILFLFRLVINPKLSQKCRFPIPVELFLVIIGTILSYTAKFHSRFNITIVGDIPRGFVLPCIPRVNLIPAVFIDAAIIAIVSFIISISLAKMFAKKHRYEINSNQELLANGIINTVTSFFSCYVCAGSLSRSMIQNEMNGRTQLAGVFSSALILVVVLWIGPLFSTVPNCILSSIIIVALYGLLLQTKQFIPLCRNSKLDGLICLVTFFSTMLLDVSYGLVCGFCFSLLTIIFRTQAPYSSLLGHIPRTEIYEDISTCSKAIEVPGIKIFRFDGSLYFASIENFCSNLYAKTGCNPQKYYSKSQDTEVERKNSIQYFYRSVKDNGKPPIVHTIILDCVAWSYIDNVGVATLKQVICDYEHMKIQLLMANCKGAIQETLNHSGFYKHYSQAQMFVSVHDAVLSTLLAHSEELQLMAQDLNSYEEICTTYDENIKVQ